jgi:hypothetical protein
MTSIGASRNRWWLLVCVIAVIALGLASRKFPSLFPGVLGKYPGDALWAMMVFGGLAIIQPRASTVRLAVIAFAISCAVEFAQLYQVPWLNAIRATTIGHLALGSTFSWFDIVAYAVGVLVASLVDVLLMRSRRGAQA